MRLRALSEPSTIPGVPMDVAVPSSTESVTGSMGDLPLAPHRDHPAAVEGRVPGEVLEDDATYPRHESSVAGSR